ncbi:MAG: DUF305 domain-containing protein [Proteobacteria bacterium]|nr:DUF305 domain-containing protein [Pseudomonadota bacterium]
MTFPSSFVFRFAARGVVFLAVALFAAMTSLAQVPIIQPGAPGQPSRFITVEEASNLASIQYSGADVEFMQGMISHHAQALEMTALVEARSNREVMRLMAQRIAISQEDEIVMMQGWLRDHDLEVPDVDAHHGPDFEAMPGMLTTEDFEALGQAQGYEFDTLFLELMIKHHDGALTMVEDLLDQRGSAQDSVLYAFTSDVTSDQTSEIERMDAMLAGFSPDPRVNLKAGFDDAGQASLNMELIASLPKPDGFFDPKNPQGLPMTRERLREREQVQETLQPDADEVANQDQESAADTEVANVEETEEEDEDEPRPSLLNFANTDISFAGDVLIAGNYHGFNSYDISDPRSPRLLSSVVCPGGQGDVSVVGNLLIYSVEQTRGRLDCGLQGVAEPESDERFRGIRIFDVSDFRAPRQVAAVQTCRGSHTHTVVTDPDDDGNIYIYGSGTGSVRPGEELEGCSDESPFENPDSALFRIDVIQIPVARPQDSRIVNRPFIFSDPNSGVIAGLWEGGDHGDDTQTTRRTNQCHDITTFPEIGLAAGACSGNGILLDISDPVNPVRLDQVIDSGFAYWHSATFNNDGTKVLFTDEWGGGSRPRCRASDPIDWGADAIYDIVDGKMQFRSHYKMPAPQTEQENCVAHNGSLVPVPGRDIFVQAWYQGGISVIDFTDSSNPVEIAFFDRGPIDAEELVMGGYWSAYWLGGAIYGTEIARGLDVFTLTPSDYLSANEIAAASFRDHDAVVNAQQQRRHRWPAEPVVARAYLDQLLRAEVIASAQAQALTAALDRADALFASGSGGDAGAVAELESLATDFAETGAGRSGTTRSRYLALASTLEGIADRLR